jgi:hypothetical protein
VFGFPNTEHSAAVLSDNCILSSVMLVAMIDSLPSYGLFCCLRYVLGFGRLTTLSPAYFFGHYIPSDNLVIVIGIESEPEDKDMCGSLNTQFIEYKLCVMQILLSCCSFMSCPYSILCLERDHWVMAVSSQLYAVVASA